MIGAGLQDDRLPRLDDEAGLQLAHLHDAADDRHLMHLELAGASERAAEQRVGLATGVGDGHEAARHLRCRRNLAGPGLADLERAGRRVLRPGEAGYGEQHQGGVDALEISHRKHLLQTDDLIVVWPQCLCGATVSASSTATSTTMLPAFSNTSVMVKLS